MPNITWKSANAIQWWKADMDKVDTDEEEKLWTSSMLNLMLSWLKSLKTTMMLSQVCWYSIEIFKYFPVFWSNVGFNMTFKENNMVHKLPKVNSTSSKVFVSDSSSRFSMMTHWLIAQNSVHGKTDPAHSSLIWLPWRMFAWNKLKKQQWVAVIPNMLVETNHLEENHQIITMVETSQHQHKLQANQISQTTTTTEETTQNQKSQRSHQRSQTTNIKWSMNHSLWLIVSWPIY